MFSTSRPRAKRRPAVRRGLSHTAREYSYTLLEQKAGYKMWAHNGIEWITDGAGNFVATVPVRSMIRFVDEGKAVAVEKSNASLDDL